jgi:tRNA(fMet)-specific endonuclease VapC
MRYLLDTNIILGYIRRNAVAKAVSGILELTEDNEVFVSVVCIGELWSIANQRQWGIARRAESGPFSATYQCADINDDALIERYAEIDAFSQNKLAGYSSGTSTRNMGKNDLWIAASASLAGATLITTEKDFDHLHNQFLDVIWILPRKVN